MRQSIITIGLSVAFLGTTIPLAIAQTIPTMNQPDNGFFEGPSPEWAIPHSTDWRGTDDHRGYHRDAAGNLLRYQPERRTSADENADRNFHQDRNMDHRQWHDGFGRTGEEASAPFTTVGLPPALPATGGNENSSDIYTGRPSARSLAALAISRQLANAH